MGIVLLAGASVSACGASDDSTPDDAATPVVETSSASTLVLIVQARIGASANGELAEHEGAFIDKRQIRSVALTVDGRDWGVYRTADAEDTVSGTLVSGFLLGSEPSPAVVPAEIGTAEDSGTPRDTVGDWTTTVSEFVEPGGHVLGIETITLAPSDGSPITLEPNLVGPFEVATGATSAFAGSFEIEFNGEGAER